MIDEKKLAKAAMSDEELDQVAGGTFEELKADAEEFESFGKMFQCSYRTGIGNMKIYDRRAVVGTFARFGVKVNFDFDKSNEYFIGGNKVTREEAWNHVKEIINKTTN